MKKFTTTVILAMVVVFLFSLTANVFAVQTPEQVYKAYNRAVRDGNYDKMVRCFTKKRKDEIAKGMKKLSPKERKEKKETIMIALQTGALVDYKVLKVEKKNGGKTAVLNVKGRPKHLMKQKSIYYYGTITFLKEGSNWKISDGKWKKKFDNQNRYNR